MTVHLKGLRPIVNGSSRRTIRLGFARFTGDINFPARDCFDRERDLKKHAGVQCYLSRRISVRLSRRAILAACRFAAQGQAKVGSVLL